MKILRDDFALLYNNSSLPKIMMLKHRIMENSSHLKMERRRRRIEAAAEDRATKKYTIYTTSQQGNQRDLLRQGRFCGAFLS